MSTTETKKLNFIKSQQPENDSGLKETSNISLGKRWGKNRTRLQWTGEPQNSVSRTSEYNARRLIRLQSSRARIFLR